MKKSVPKTFPLGLRNDPTLDTWKRLFESIRDFHKRRPWDDLLNEDLFEVVDPVSDQSGYCCVMGNGGMEFGMSVYLGDAGLRTFHKTAMEEIDAKEMVEELHGIVFLFCTREFLDDRDLSPIKKLLMPFRGDGWPQMRSYNPGYLPWYITDNEARFLHCCIEQALIVADERADNFDLIINEGPKGKILCRMSESSDGTLRWKTTYRTLNIPAEIPLPEYEPDEFSLAALVRKATGKGDFWEVDCISMPTPIMDTEPPRLPKVFVCVESKVGLALGYEMFTPDQDYFKLSCEKLSALLGEQKEKPSEIHFRNPRLAGCLGSFLDRVGIKSIITPKLAILAEFEDGMNQNLSKVR